MLERWRIGDFAPGDGFAAGAHEERFPEEGWIGAEVPGDVHTALLRAGRIEDPFYGRNEGRCSWVEEREWWYRTAFTGPEEPLGEDERLRLVFGGLDTFATVWLNGKELGSHENMFREAVFDVSEEIRFGRENVLAVRFDPPLERVSGREVPGWAVNEARRVLMRKAQFGYGWDWGPRLPTVGIWRPVELRRERGAALSGVHFYTLELGCDRALVAVRVEAERFAGRGRLGVRARLASPAGGEVAAGVVDLRGEERPRGTLYLEIKDPEPWWPNGLGEPALYGLRVELQAGGEVLESREQKVGIRTVELDQSPDPDEPGSRHFRFVVNGVPVFARGANWIPADSFPGSITPGRYRALVLAAREANMNMLRVWGGGVYEHDAFYEACDECGVLVWQDFMFSCAAYPEDEEMAAEVEAEAEYQVKRLRNHPCLALWCGNNENQWIHDQKHWDEPGSKVPGSLYYDEILPRVVREHDGRTPYWPGSPYGGDDHNSMQDGDRHNWDVWHGSFPRRFGERPRREPTPQNVSYERYAEDEGRFISEFGMHAAPSIQTLKRVIPEEELYHHSPSMDHHNKDEPKDKGDNLMLTVTGLPETLEEYVDYSQISQAEGLKFAIEHFRRRKPHCSGTLIWQLDDCWPGLSWSIIDYYGRGKAGYHYAKRAYSPVLASFKETEEGTVELWVTNDTTRPAEDRALVSLKTFAGKVLREEEVTLRVPANASRPVVRWEGVEGGNDRYLSVRSDGGLFPKNRHFFRAIKDLALPEAVPEITAEQGGEDLLRVTLEAPAYLYFVHVEAPDGRPSDDYFDLEAGEKKVIEVRGSVGRRDVRVHWRRFGEDS
ncbi:glycoside hydrolase family 2 protein [Rubrobacter naiadicus]|uniref:glycoside hydrolase family 2 protein n=1 Tax=Rubrobacter naiadicus TaxID=1392641 RepID=UPI00235FD22C|nr:beta galactosidase jelly roll domain-containing protein [Rubrobacter naiadicus]